MGEMEDPSIKMSNCSCQKIVFYVNHYCNRILMNCQALIVYLKEQSFKNCFFFPIMDLMINDDDETLNKSVRCDDSSVTIVGGSFYSLISVSL